MAHFFLLGHETGTGFMPVSCRLHDRETAPVSWHETRCCGVMRGFMPGFMPGFMLGFMRGFMHVPCAAMTYWFHVGFMLVSYRFHAILCCHTYMMHDARWCGARACGIIALSCSVARFTNYFSSWSSLRLDSIFFGGPHIQLRTHFYPPPLPTQLRHRWRQGGWFSNSKFMLVFQAAVSCRFHAGFMGAVSCWFHGCGFMSVSCMFR